MHMMWMNSYEWHIYNLNAFPSERQQQQQQQHKKKVHVERRSDNTYGQKIFYPNIFAYGCGNLCAYLIE